MEHKLAISFGRSTSPQYAQAVKIASSFPEYTKEGDEKKGSHSVAVTIKLDEESTWNELAQLMQLIAGWKSTKIALDGKQTSFWKLSSEIGSIQECYQRKVAQGAGDYYCAGKLTPTDTPTHFGCRFLKGVARHVADYGRDGPAWTQFGQLSPDNTSFAVDKSTILTTLEAQAEKALCAACPAFSVARIRSDVEELPSSIQLGEKSKFELTFSDIIPDKALGIKLKDWAYRLGSSWGTLVHGRDDPIDEEDPQRIVPNVRYCDVAGQDFALLQIKNLLQLPLTHPEYFAELRVEPPMGVILYGPPGNGKTLIAKAVATESNAHFELLNGPEVLTKWVGESERKLREVFERARKLAPSVILIDELDSIAPRRDLMEAHHQVQLISQLLVLLDGLESRGKVAVIATTNRIDAIDPAIRRSGRFDYHIEVTNPDQAGRLAILRVHLLKMKVLEDFQFDDVAAKTEGFSGAELASLCREAGLNAIRRGVSKELSASELAVSRADLFGAIEALKAKRTTGEA